LILTDSKIYINMVMEGLESVRYSVSNVLDTAYWGFLEGRYPDISYFYVFGCPVHIHNHKDHLGKFDEKADDGFFLGYSLVAKTFRVFNIRRQEMEETYHVTFSEDDKITQCSGNIEYFPYIHAYKTIHENITPTDSAILQDFVSPVEPPEFTSTDDHPTLNEHDLSELTNILEPAEIQDSIINEPIYDHIELVNIIGEPMAGITTRSRIRDLEAASAHECLYVNFLSEMEPKKLIKALEEEGWIIAMQEELNKF
ncbi:hypothetical protein Tco_0167927, partial [Tanacetum coccineum]